MNSILKLNQIKHAFATCKRFTSNNFLGQNLDLDKFELVLSSVLLNQQRIIENQNIIVGNQRASLKVACGTTYGQERINDCPWKTAIPFEENE